MMRTVADCKHCRDMICFDAYMGKWRDEDGGEHCKNTDEQNHEPEGTD